MKEYKVIFCGWNVKEETTIKKAYYYDKTLAELKVICSRIWDKENENKKLFKLGICYIGIYSESGKLLRQWI